MTEKEKKRLLAKAEKLKPKPTLLPSGSWRCQVIIDGKRKSVTADTPEAAHAQAVAMREGFLEDQARLSKDAITLGDAIEKYVEDRRPVLSPSTVRSYLETKKNRIKDLQAMRVMDITEDDIQRSISAATRAGKSPKTIKNDITLAVAVISRYKDISTKNIKYPPKVKKEHKFLEPKEIEKLIAGCEGDPAEVPILLALWLGLRRSEILGLCWDCIDFKNRRIAIKRALVRDDKGVYAIKEYTKNESSSRSVSCPDYILDKINGLPGDRTGRLFKTNDTSFIYDSLKEICEREGITFPGVHGLRHTNASVMLSLGIVDKHAMARGGWSTDYTMKNVYQHLFSEDRESADAAINEFFKGKIAHKIAHDSSDPVGAQGKEDE